MSPPKNIIIIGHAIWRRTSTRLSMKRTEMRTIYYDNGNSYALIDHLHKQTIRIWRWLKGSFTSLFDSSFIYFDIIRLPLEHTFLWQEHLQYTIPNKHSSPAPIGIDPESYRNRTITVNISIVECVHRTNSIITTLPLVLYRYTYVVHSQF